MADDNNLRVILDADVLYVLVRPRGNESLTERIEHVKKRFGERGIVNPVSTFSLSLSAFPSIHGNQLVYDVIDPEFLAKGFRKQLKVSVNLFIVKLNVCKFSFSIVWILTKKRQRV